MTLQIKMIHSDHTQEHIQTAHTALSVFTAEKSCLAAEQTQ